MLEKGKGRVDMYFKSEKLSSFFTPSADERIVGKVNLRNGLAAIFVLLGFVAVIVFLSCGYAVAAVLSGVVAAVLLALIICDPTGLLRRKTKRDKPDNRRE